MVTEAFDLAGARRASEEGRLLEWTLGKVTREGRANRPLAAILRGQRPLLSGPVEVPIRGLQRIAGGEPGLKYSVPMAQWERELVPLMEVDPETQPPVLLRYGHHVADGNHRVDAWARRGFDRTWAILWEDADPRFRDWWTPFLPEVSPTFATHEEERGTVFEAISQGTPVGCFRLTTEGFGLALRDLWVDPAWRGLRLAARMLRVARPLMDGKTVHALAPTRLVRFFSEAGFRPVADPDDGWVRLRREP